MVTVPGERGASETCRFGGEIIDFARFWSKWMLFDGSGSPNDSRTLRGPRRPPPLQERRRDAIAASER
jgi:hypothetical protein